MLPRAQDVPEKFGAYTRSEELGRGAFAIVFGCKKAGTSSRLAVKAFDLRFLRTARNAEREVKKLQREAQILKQVPAHPNIVRFVDIVQESSDWLFFVLELVPGGDLMKWMVRRPGKRPRLQEPEALFVFKQLVEGLGWLHEQGVIHRDLKLENVLISKVRQASSSLLCFLDVKITDFGLSRFVGPEFSEPRSTVGSPRYMAPEVKASGTHHLPADFWSLGILLTILLGGRFPCDGLPHVPQATLDDAVKKLPASGFAQSVASGLLQLEPQARLNIIQLRKHIWLTNSNSSSSRVSTTPSRQSRGGASSSSTPSRPGGRSTAADEPRAAASPAVQEPKAKEAKRARLGAKSQDDQVVARSPVPPSRSRKTGSLWSNSDDKTFENRIAEVTSALQEHHSPLRRKRALVREPSTPATPSTRTQIVAVTPPAQRHRRIEEQKKPSKAKPKAKGSPARRGPTAAFSSISSSRSSPSPKPVSKKGGKKVTAANKPKGKAAPATAPKKGKATPPPMKNATNSKGTDKAKATAMKRTAKEKKEVKKKPASAGAANIKKRPAAR